MAVARDWSKSLWLCSFKGAAFWVEADGETGGRRIVKHQIPMRDEPYLEDLGEDLREFEVTAYVASDRADTEADALVAVCTSRGPGIVILPTQGPIFVRCEKIKRDHKRDKLGYIAFTINFTREGYGSALFSVNSLANLIFVQVESLAVSVAASFASSFTVSGSPATSPQLVDYVVSAASDNLQLGVAALEGVRATSALDPDVDGAQLIALQSMFDTVPAALADDPTITPLAMVASARAIAGAMTPASAISAFESVFLDGSFQFTSDAVYPTQNLRAAAVNEAAAKRVTRLAALAAYSETIARMTIPDRQAGITLRANVQEYFEAEIVNLPAFEIELLRAIEQMGDVIVNYLSTSITNLSPVVTVETNIQIPSLVAAWRLYQDPLRGAEIVSRNRVQHPSFLPTTFQALAS